MISENTNTNATWKDDKILVWIDVFTRPDSSWRESREEPNWKDWKPRSEEEKAAFSSLIARENRQLLKKWYSNKDWLEGSTDHFRQILEQATGDSLRKK